MPYAAAFGRHAARRGARRLLLAALLGLLIAMFTPGFTPPAQASGQPGAGQQGDQRRQDHGCSSGGRCRHYAGGPRRYGAPGSVARTFQPSAL